MVSAAMVSVTLLSAGLALLLALTLHQLQEARASAAAAESRVTLLKRAVLAASASAAPSSPPPAVQSCQTRCDRECSRFDDCKGEAWVCLNLFELLESDSGPVPAGPPFDQCFEPVRSERTRRELKALARTYLSPGAEAVGIEQRSLAFQREAERTLRDDDGGSTAGAVRRVPHDLLASAARSGWTAGRLVAALTGAECQPHGLSLRRLARERTFNRTHWTFRTRNLHADALMFLFDLFVNYGTRIDSASWLGATLEQDPYDAMALQALIARLKPGLIVETGTFEGGSALFYASILRLAHPSGRVHTIDPWSRRLERSRRTWGAEAVELFDSYVTYHARSSLDPRTLEAVQAAANRSDGPVLVVLDSSHRGTFVAKELALYAPLVTVGSYVVCQDTKLDRYLAGFEDEPNIAPYWKEPRFRWTGPASAVAAFVKANPNFEVDRTAEPGAAYSQHTKGFLRRVE